MGHKNAPKIDLTKLPPGAPDFLGRVAELKLLDDAWTDAGRTQVVELVAPGGVGKTSLVKRWLDRLKADSWRGAQQVYGWSFFSQGTSDDRQASDDSFLDAALCWFEVKHDPALSPWDKGKRLAEAVAASRTLLVLDGVEPLQYPPGPLAGQLHAPGLQALLSQLASAGQPGLCILTTRERIQDLAEYERSADYPTGAVVRHDLGNLSEADGARLLHKLGVRRAGAAAIASDDAELKHASREVRGHALTLSLLGSYLAQAHAGDIRQRDKVEFEDADAETHGGYAFKVMAAYEKWFQREGEQGARELATLRLLGFFDRPADAGCLAVLRQTPPIPGLTEPLVDLSTAQWNITLSRLKDCGLIEPAQPDSPSLDAHPLVREYLAKALRERQPDVWREGHRRIYEHLKASVCYQPDRLCGLQPLYQAVAHGCQAELYEDTRVKIYQDRIQRGKEGYSTFKLGAVGADLGAVRCFFKEPWKHLAPSLSEDAQAWLFNEAAFSLRALGRGPDALEPLRAALAIDIKQLDWESAAKHGSCLSELELTLGNVEHALTTATQSVAYADHSQIMFERIACRVAYADALHQAGCFTEALIFFREAEQMQLEHQQEYPLLHSWQGFAYCDFLLTAAEHAAWRVICGVTSSSNDDHHLPSLQETCLTVYQRAKQILKWTEAMHNASLLDLALPHLSMGLATLYGLILNKAVSVDNSQTPRLISSFSENIQHELITAVSGHEKSGQQDDLPRSLLARAFFRILQSDFHGTRADLDEAWRIASRGDMRLFMADIHLHRARLFRDEEELKKARDLIEQCGYWRRKEELEDAEAAAHWETISAETGSQPTSARSSD